MINPINVDLNLYLFNKLSKTAHFIQKTFILQIERKIQHLQQ